MPVFMGIVFITVGVLLAIWAGYAGVSSLKTNHWPTASGRIVASRIEVKKGIKQPGTASKRHDYYSPAIEYQYSVGGKEYTASKIEAYFGGKTSYAAEWQANQVLTKYPEGKNVLVFYDPKDPSRACIEPGVPWKLVLPMSLFALLSVGVGIALIFYVK